MKVTARQLKTADSIGMWGVVSAETDRRANTTEVELINPRGLRNKITYPANKILIIDRAEVDGSDPLARPYWWGLEAEQEQRQEREAYLHEEMLAASGVWI